MPRNEIIEQVLAILSDQEERYKTATRGFFNLAAGPNKIGAAVCAYCRSRIVSEVGIDAGSAATEGRAL